MSDTMAYIGRKKCGCYVAATVDDPNDPKETAKSVADFVKSGLTIERVTAQFVRDNLHFCKHKKAEKQGSLDL